MSGWIHMSLSVCLSLFNSAPEAKTCSLIVILNSIRRTNTLFALRYLEAHSSNLSGVSRRDQASSSTGHGKANKCAGTSADCNWLCGVPRPGSCRSEEHTSELQSRQYLV